MKTYRVTRPEDPSLRAAYDEAKRLCEARGATQPERDELWAAIRKAVADDDCCVGDRAQCRCQARGGWSDEDVDREKWIAVWEDSDDV